MTDERARGRGCGCVVNEREWSRDASGPIMRKVRERRATRSSASRAVGGTKFIATRYVYLVEPDKSYPSKELLIANHAYLNQCFNAQNTGLSKLPTSGPYGVASLQGNANIVFLPSNADRLPDPVRVFVPSGSISSTQPLQSVLDLAPPVDNVMNIYMAAIPGNILGEARLPGHVMVISTITVGSPTTPGVSGFYGQGGTLTHEAGHCLGLPHPFSGCNNATFQAAFPDITPQFNPAPFGELYQREPGVWDGRLCNRYLDCKVYNEGDESEIPNNDAYKDAYAAGAALSCLPCNDEPVGGCDANCGVNLVGERFMLFMGYATDANAVCFFESQTEFMNAYLESELNTTLQVLSEDPGNSGYTATEAPSTATPTSTSKSVFTPLVITAIVLAAVLVIALIVAGALGAFTKKTNL